MSRFKLDGWSWYLHVGRRIVALKSPKFPSLFSEREAVTVKTIPLGFGWRITIRKIL